ncbi:hypothetical protein RESH_03907 [Rhodopirellula europaea SH398]|uniref:Uncharacterized protein n=1 Tax=Rhodopirellula europaea SH398 TaxID=1263868 RepID=M5S271_9BACT|nr:hypothetical protein RESH_03907 [Rhodopirellula europaea SH398]
MNWNVVLLIDANLETRSGGGAELRGDWSESVSSHWRLRWNRMM